MWGIVPAGGCGSRIQPLAFSKELLPVGSRFDGKLERPKAVSEYLIERMIAGGATKICIILSPAKSDILRYYGAGIPATPFCYVVQQNPAGLCDAIFRALPLIGAHEGAIVGLPDTIWFPADSLRTLPDGELSFLLFPVSRPELFDAVVTDSDDRVLSIQVKKPDPQTSWIWGAFKLSGAILQELFTLWCERNRSDEYFGSLINAYLESGGRAMAVRAGASYVDVGTLNGYREALELLQGKKVKGLDGELESGTVSVAAQE